MEHGHRTGTTRALIMIHTDEGSPGRRDVWDAGYGYRALEVAKSPAGGARPARHRALHHRLGVFRIGYETTVPATLRAGSRWPASMRPARPSIARFIRCSAARSATVIEVAAYLFYRYADDGLGGETSLSRSSTVPGNSLTRYGFRTIKLKGGVFSPEDEFEAVKRLAARFPDRRFAGTPTPPGRCRPRCELLNDSRRHRPRIPRGPGPGAGGHGPGARTRCRWRRTCASSATSSSRPASGSAPST